ncbi:hypothetical protein PCANC_24217, partial [Puccinia coronata f. sp. avenae]
MSEISTSDYSTLSGEDDTSDSQSEEVSLSTPKEQESNRLKEKVKYPLLNGYHGPQIINILKERHGISISIGTLNRRRKLWGLQQHQLPQGPSPGVQASIRSSHSKGLNLEEMQARLLKETQVDASIRTIQRYLKQLNLKQIVNDIHSGKVTKEK